MTGDAMHGRGSWRKAAGRPARPASPARASAAKWTTATLLSSAMLAILATTAWLVWQFAFPSSPSPYFVAFWVGEYEKRAAADQATTSPAALSSPIPPIPWMEADRE